MSVGGLGPDCAALVFVFSGQGSDSAYVELGEEPEIGIVYVMR
jgi:hypothetical protein